MSTTPFTDRGLNNGKKKETEINTNKSRIQQAT